MTDQKAGDAGTATVSCTVSPASGGSFHVQIQTSIGSTALQIDVPSISANATANAPATGSIVYDSPQTVDSYAGEPCSFYFTGTGEGVSAGKFVGAFTCAKVTDPSSNPPSTCALAESYVAVENCATKQ